METPVIFETHAHYDDEAFAQDRENLLASMQEHGIGYIVNACASIESLKDTEELMEQYPFVYGAFGIHPDDAEDYLLFMQPEHLQHLLLHKQTAVFYTVRRKVDGLYVRILIEFITGLACSENNPYVAVVRRVADDSD